MEQVVDYGLLTLVPPLVVIVMALLTKRTIEPLIVGGIILYNSQRDRIHSRLS